MVVPRRHLRIVVRNNVDFSHGCHGSSALVDVDSVQVDADFLCAGADLLCKFGLKMVETRRQTLSATTG